MELSGKASKFSKPRFTISSYPGVKLADAGATTRTIQSITGHKTPEQVKAYVATVNKKRLAKKDMALIDGNKIRK